MYSIFGPNAQTPRQSVSPVLTLGPVVGPVVGPVAGPQSRGQSGSTQRTPAVSGVRSMCSEPIEPITS